MASLDEAKQIIKDTPISSVINYYLPLNKKGANYEGLCPFHGDSHPSLKVNDNEGMYKCFVCGVGGDAIGFVKDFKKIDYVEAVKDIASNLGVTVELTEKKKLNPKFELGFRVMNAAYRLYKKVVEEKRPENFKKFLAERKISEETVQNFGIGYAPATNAFFHYLQSLPAPTKDKAIALALEIGIIKEGKWGPYDFYRDRVMFPIFDHSGQVRGFSSRDVLPDQLPKYLNSGESFLFDKGNILYGFHLARNHIRSKDAVIIVEGQMDVVSMHQYGFNYTVGASGIAVSQKSARLLTHMAKNIYLGLDSDNAGLTAMERIQAEFMQFKVLPKVIDYSPAKDPDDFLKEFGRIKLQERIDNAPLFIDFLFDKKFAEAKPQTTDQRLFFLNNVFSWLAPLGPELVARELAIGFAKKLGLQSSSDDITHAFNQFLSDNKPIQAAQVLPHEETPMFIQEDTPEAEAPEHEEILNIPVPKAEKILLDKIVTHPETLSHSEMSEILDLVYHFEVKRLVQWLKNIYLEIDDTDYADVILRYVNTQNFSNEINHIVGNALYNHTGLRLNDKVVDKLMKDIIFKLKENRLKNKREKLKEQQKNAVSEEDAATILEEIQKVQIEINQLRKR